MGLVMTVLEAVLEAGRGGVRYLARGAGVGMAGSGTCSEGRGQLGSGQACPLALREDGACGGQKSFVAAGTTCYALEGVGTGAGRHRRQMHSEVGGDARDGPVGVKSGNACTYDAT
jgi:hypothetical protein